MVNVNVQTEVATGASQEFFDITSNLVAYTSSNDAALFFSIPGIVNSYAAAGLFDSFILPDTNLEGMLRTGLQATLAEFGFIDTDLFPPADAFIRPGPAILPAALSDPDFPADLRPEDSDAATPGERLIAE